MIALAPEPEGLDKHGPLSAGETVVKVLERSLGIEQPFILRRRARVSLGVVAEIICWIYAWGKGREDDQSCDSLLLQPIRPALHPLLRVRLTL